MLLDISFHTVCVTVAGKVCNHEATISSPYFKTAVSKCNYVSFASLYLYTCIIQLLIDYICTTSRMKGPVDAENHLEILLCFCACPTRTNCQRQCSVCTFVEVPYSCTCIQNNNMLKRSATTNSSYVALGILTCLLIQQGSPIAILKHKM